MTSRRRRANDFTDSLNSFRQTFVQDQSHAMSQSYSEDSLDYVSTKGRQHENNNQESYRKNKARTGSIILAGHLASDSISLPDLTQSTYKDRQVLSNNINISDETSYLSLKLDLNKCINLFHNECLRKENCTSEELSSSAASENRINRSINMLRSKKSKTVEIQCNLSRDSRSASLTSLRNLNCSYNEMRKSKSCVTFNENIRKDIDNDTVDLFSLTNRETATKINSQEKGQVDTSLSETLLVPTSSTSINKNTDLRFTKALEKCDVTSSSEKSSLEELNPVELKALLNSLEDQKLWREEEMQNHLFRRMSANFYDAPRNFTEQLLTIIEESVVNSDAGGSFEYPEVSLRRLTEELRKMCKFVGIEDETVPEWPQSPSMLMPNNRKNSEGDQECKLDSLWKNLSAIATPDRNLCASMRRNSKSPQKICRRIPKINLQSPKLHDSTSTFEYLESYYKTLYPNEYRTPPGERKYSPSPLRDMKNILLRCKKQMASLEDSPKLCSQQLKKTAISTVDSPCKSDAVLETQDLRYKLHEKRDRASLMNISDVLGHKRHSRSSKCEMTNRDNLENTIIYELAKKRQKCLDTAKMHIDTNPEPASFGVAEEQSTSNNAIVESSDIEDSKFKETLMTVKKYQNYLEQCKPLLNLLQQTESDTSRSSCSEKDVRLKEVSKPLKVPRFPTRSKTSPSAKAFPNQLNVPKPTLFVTPGKRPIKRTCNAKRTYFPNLITGTSTQKDVISPQEKNVYRQMGSYDHVKSPVGMYIRSTNPSLVKNLRPKTDKMLLTPRKKQITSPASPKPKMKFRLSPKEMTEKVPETEVTDENIVDNYLHPKVHYKLPSNVRTIKEAEMRKGNRVNELLRTMQDKVVIRHEDRIKSVKTDCLELPEIHYISAEESVHVEQTARKTHFSRI